MPHIVLIHGVGQQYESRDQLEAAWIPALAGGVGIAGNAAIADKIASKVISTRMVFFGDLFRQTGAMGAAEQMPSAPFTEALALEWLKNAAHGKNDERALAAKRELFALDPGDAQAQGAGRHVRAPVNALMRVPWIARLGMEFATRFLLSALSQLTDYFQDEEKRKRIIQRVDATIDDDTVAVVGHSLGSVIAFEACHRLVRPLPLLVTLGSPIGLETIVLSRLLPSPPSFPPHVVSWLNLSDIDDVAAAKTDLKPIFEATIPPRAAMINAVIDNGADSHSAVRYLNTREAGEAIARSMQAL